MCSGRIVGCGLGGTDLLCMFMGRDLGFRACCPGLGGTDLFKGLWDTDLGSRAFYTGLGG